MSPVQAPREAFFIIGAVHGNPQPNLLEVIEAIGLAGFGFGLGQGREQHSREDGNDRNHHQQFDQGKRLPSRRLQNWFHTVAHIATSTE
jgi:hypothetical protein